MSKIRRILEDSEPVEDVLPPKRLENAPTLVLRPRMADTLESAQCVAEEQMRAYLHKAKTEGLSNADVQAYTKLVDALTKLERVEREQLREIGPQSMPEHELRQFVREAIDLGIIDVEPDEVQ